jgi:hypothetical protein
MHRVKSSFMLLGVGLAVMLALFLASGGVKTERAFAGTVDFDGTYDIVVRSGNVGLFHCISNLSHDTGTNAVDSRLQCYTTTPGLTPGSPLVPGAAWADITVAAAPPTPPPYTTGAPQTQSGTATDANMTLSGCFANFGGTLGPNIITVASFTNPGTDLGADGIISGTVDIYIHQTIANCTAVTPDAGTANKNILLNDQAVDLHQTGTAGEAVWRLGSSTDYDGDGCTDVQELTDPAPAACGDDPYNPNDSVTDFDGPVSIQATAIRADWNTTTNAVIPGSYFHCLGYTDHNTGTDAITTTVQCYTDSPAIGGAGGSGIPGSGDGLPGAPPPRIDVRAATAFTTGAPVVNTGAYDSGTGVIATAGCFADIGPPLGPNVITVATIDATTGQGTVLIYFSQTNAACAAKIPLGNPAITATLEVASQNTGQDSDGDGCTDQDEVLGAANCGDDPYNKWDGDGLTDGGLTGVYTLNFAPVPADIDDSENSGGDAGGANSCYDKVDNGGADGADGADADDCNVIAGQYANCIIDMVFTSGVLDGPAICYVDSSVLGNAGDGMAGAPPPFAPDPLTTSYVNPTTARQVITGSLAVSTLTTNQCLVNVDIPPAGPTGNKDVKVTATLNAYTGHGTGDIELFDPNSTCTTGGSGVVLSGDLDVAPQGPRYAAAPAPATLPSVDTDKDGCRDEQEIKITGSPSAQGVGGRRDPHNRWDLMDQWIGAVGSQTKDRLISGGDIGRVVALFGKVGDPLGDPNALPTSSTAYHTSADRNAVIPGAGQWNLKPPNGNVSGGDIAAAVAQFGHTCTSS